MSQRKKGRKSPNDDAKRMTPTFEMIPVSQIHPAPDAVRKKHNKAAQGRLGASLEATHGNMRPIIVVAKKNVSNKKEFYEIIDGHRTYYAALQSGIAALAAIVLHQEIGRYERLMRQLVHASLHQKLGPEEVANALVELKECLGDADEDAVWGPIENALGLSRRRRQQLLAILKLPKDLQSRIRWKLGGKSEEGGLTERHVRVLAKLPTALIPAMFERVENERLSAGETDRLVRHKLGKSVPRTYGIKITFGRDQDPLEQLDKEIERIRGEIQREDQLYRATLSQQDAAGGDVPGSPPETPVLQKDTHGHSHVDADDEADGLATDENDLWDPGQYPGDLDTDMELNRDATILLTNGSGLDRVVAALGGDGPKTAKEISAVMEAAGREMRPGNVLKVVRDNSELFDIVGENPKQIRLNADGLRHLNQSQDRLP